MTQMGAQITPMKNGDSYGSPVFIGVICAPNCVICVPMLLRNVELPGCYQYRSATHPHGAH
jgi:hypothetical protein